MTTYAFPSVTPNVSSIELVSNTKIFMSPISGAIQTIDRGGERWVWRLNFVSLAGTNRAVMQAFLVKLNGQQHRFTLHNHAENQRGNFGGTPLVFGAGQTGISLDADGVGSVSDWIMAGDWFAVNGELKQCIADANSSAGSVTITFRPRLRTAPGNNDPITTSSAVGTFLLGANSVKWSNRPGGFSDLSFTAIEDIAA